MMPLRLRYLPKRCHGMQNISRTLARPKRINEQCTKIIRRKLPLKLYELEPESGEDESLHVDLNLDQIED
jgi:hypothetical protein